MLESGTTTLIISNEEMNDIMKIAAAPAADAAIHKKCLDLARVLRT